MYCRKAEIEVLFDNKPSSSSDGDNFNSKATAEAQVLVRAENLVCILLSRVESVLDLIYAVSVYFCYPLVRVSVRKLQK